MIKPIRIMCPLRHANEYDDENICKSNCAWWTTINVGGHPKSMCAIVAIATNQGTKKNERK